MALNVTVCRMYQVVKLRTVCRVLCLIITSNVETVLSLRCWSYKRWDIMREDVLGYYVVF